MLRKTLAAFSVLLAPVIAHASPSDGAAVHDFATLDRASGESGAGVDLSYVTGDLGDVDGGISRLDLHGQYMLNRDFGVYGTFAVSKSFLSSDDPFGQMFADTINDATAISNLELGGQFRRRLSNDLVMVAHAGIALPTAQDDDFGAVASNLLSIQRRLGDLVTAMPGATTLRAGVSPTWSHGMVFARADLGADIVIDAPEDTDVDPIVHANVAVGARSGKLSGAAELVTVATTGDVDEDTDRFLHTAALSLRYDAGRFAPSLTLITPLEDFADVVTVGAGLAAKF